MLGRWRRWRNDQWRLKHWANPDVYRIHNIWILRDDVRARLGL